MCGRAKVGHGASWRRGVTLVELLVAMGLFSLILLLLTQVLVPGLRIWKHARAVADIEQQAMVAEDRIVRALLTSVAGSVQSIDRTDLQALGALSHQGNSALAGYDGKSGNPLWKRVEVFYVRPDDQVLYQTFWDGSAGAPLPYTLPQQESFRVTSEELASLCGPGSGQGRRRLADKVTKLTLARVPGQERFVLTLSLTTNVPTGTKSVEREISVVPRMRERE